ncbi:MAG: FtsW/RodA/SpoVE family cell cycle protein [Bacillus sp. (in: firmicutes)]
MKDKNYFDYALINLLIIIMAFSSVALYNSQKYVQVDGDFFKKQLTWFALSLIIMFLIFLLNMDVITNLTPFIYGFGILALVFVLAAPDSIAPEIKGANSWIILPGLGSIQPSEFMKIFLILMLAYLIIKHAEKHPPGDLLYDLILLGKLGAAASLPIGLTLLQNDFGTSLVMFVITCGVILVSGINWKYIVTCALIGVLVVAVLVYIYLYNDELLLSFLDTYQINRIHAWLDPFGNAQGIGYQLKQSILSIGSGMTFGKGFGASDVYVPEAHTDFIFAIIGEEFGFIGASILICVYFSMIFRIIGIGLSAQPFESYFCAGVASLLFFHIFQNIGMVIGLLPITGIPLPLMSYGGSSVMATMLGISIVLNISLKKRKYMFSKK